MFCFLFVFVKPSTTAYINDIFPDNEQYISVEWYLTDTPFFQYTNTIHIFTKGYENCCDSIPNPLRFAVKETLVFINRYYSTCHPMFTIKVINSINKTSIQWTPEVKFISATLKKILVKNDFWTTKSKKFSWKKFFFQKKFEKNKIWGKKFLKKNFEFFFNFK